MSRTETISIPRPCSPAAGMRLHRHAVHFCWGATEDGFGYQIQWATRPDFEDAPGMVVQNLRDADRHACFPREPLSAGEWYWRVRTMNREGMFGRWSPANRFRVIPDAAPMPPEYALTTANPLFILYSADDIVAHWADVPESLKACTALRVERSRAEELYALCELARQKQIPLVLQLAGPHDSYNGRYARIPLPDVESLFQQFPMVRGVQIVEQACQGGLKEPAVKAYLLGMMQLAADYGRLAVWADGHWHGCNIWIEAALDTQVFETLRRCREYVVPLWKMNCGWSPLTIHGTVFGLWMSGAASNWGVEPESWFWYEAGYRGSGEPQRGFKEGDIALCPAPFWGQMILLGLSSGATVYGIEPPSGIWSAPGTLSESGAQVIFPLFQCILDWSLIPTKASVRETVRIGYMASEADVEWREDAGPLQAVHTAFYGVDHPSAMLPANGGHGWLPIVSPRLPLAAKRDLALPYIDASSFRSRDQVRAFLHGLGHTESLEEAEHAWVLEVGDLVLVMNHHENQDAANAFRVPLRPPFARMEGQIAVNGYLLCQQLADGTLRIHANGRSDRPLKLALFLETDRCHIRAAPPAAGETLRHEGREIRGTLAFTAGAVTLIIDAGAEPDRADTGSRG